MPQDPAIREAARQKADAARANRKRLRAAFKSGTIDGCALLEGNEPMWEDIARKTKVLELLKMFPGVGEITAVEVLQEVAKTEGIDLDSATRLGLLSFAVRATMADIVRKALNAHLA